MMMPQALDLKYFLTVCESKNISRASERLGISQPSLSMAIKRLESLAGMPLFIRSKTGVEATRAGIVFKERAEELLDLWQNLSSDIKKQSDLLSGRYVIGAHISLALKTIPALIGTLIKNYPSLELSLEHGLSRVITDQVIGFAIDFAIVVNPTPHPDLVIREFQSDQVGFYRAHDEVDKNVLIFDPHLLQSQSLLNVLKKYGLSFKRTISTSSLEMVNALTLQGAGIGILPARIADPALMLWDEVLPQFADRHCLVYRADAQTSPAARLLAKELMRLLIAPTQVQ
jgi:DNA-binding transcriptional LysR family regulator